MDRLARRGLQVVDAISPAPLTLPSHSTMLTGLLPPQHGVRENGLFHLPDNMTTVAELLPESIETGAVVGAFPLIARFGLAQGFDRYDDDFRSSEDRTRMPERTATEAFEAALAWLESVKGARPFLWVHVYDPHYPYAPPPPWPNLTRESSMSSAYDCELAYTDRALGQFLGVVESGPSGRNPSVLLVSDHGESLGSHKELTHGLFIYDATQRVPMIMTGPGISPALETRQRTLLDVAPTILDSYEVASPVEWKGTALRKPPRGHDAYIETMSTELMRGWSSLYGIRTERWKYIRAPRPELYDIVNDPAESENLIDAERSVSDELERTLSGVLAEGRKPLDAAADEETLSQLRSLGYIATVTPGKGERGGKDPKDGIDGAVVLFHGEQAYLDADFGRAEVLLRRALQLEPGSKEAHSYLAGTYYGLGRFSLTVEFARRALELEPHINEGPIHMTLGEAYLALERPKDAIRPLEEAVRLLPRSAKARGLLDRARSSAG